MAKITDYSPASSISTADIFYVVQNVAGTNVSKTVSFATLMGVVPTKTSFTQGINLGASPQQLSNTGTINTAGVTGLSLTTAGSFVLPAGNQGDTKVIVTELNPSFANTIVGTFANGITSIDAGLTGIVTTLLFHNGKWYKK